MDEGRCKVTGVTITTISQIVRPQINMTDRTHKKIDPKLKRKQDSYSKDFDFEKTGR